MPDAGQPAPDFTLPGDDGSDHSLSDLRPAPVVLFFYPKDDTPGCTKEASGFSAEVEKFQALGVKVFGISKDSLAKHAKFRDKHDLRVVLLSDADSDVCERFGVWVEKKMYGKTFMGIERATFLIDGAGQIAQAWRKVKVDGHVDAVLAAATELAG